jgi:hypothetical protein
MIAELWKWLISFVLGGIITYFIEHLKHHRSRDQAIEEGLEALLRAEIIRQYEKHIERGFCPLYAKEALKREYHAYHTLGGNDVATELYHKSLELPDRPPITKKGMNQ